MRIFLFLTIIFVLASACTPVRNTINPFAFACGADAGPGSLVKVLQENGDDLSPELLAKLNASFQLENGNAVPLQRSSRGCLKMPDATGQLFVLAPGINEGLVLTYAPGPKFSRQKLHQLPPMDSKLRCSQERLFAHQSLPLLWTSHSAANNASYRFQLNAINEASGERTELFTKELGIAQLDLPASADTSALPEGLYRLEASYRNPLNGWQSAPILLNEGPGCAFAVLHKAPSPIRFESPIMHAKSGDLIPLQNGEGKLRNFICMEARNGRVGESSCKASGPCLSPAAFQEVPYFSPKESGLFDLFVYAIDQAGNKSETSCQTFAVSDAAPFVSVAWDRDDWNRSGSIMDLPYADVSATINVQHDFLDPAFVASTLECKVDFVRGEERMGGTGAVCMNGRCAGKSLEDYVPCDAHMRFSLTKAWGQQGVSRSLMQLHVRANDGSKHYKEAVRSLWLNDSLWEVEDFNIMAKGHRQTPSEIFTNKDGSILATFSSMLDAMVFNGTFWNEVPGFPDQRLGFVFLNKGEIRAIFHYEEMGEHKSTLAVLKNERWVQEITELPRLSYYIQGKQDTIYLAGDTDLYRIVEGKALSIPLPSSVSEDFCSFVRCESIAIRPTADGDEIFLADAENLYRLDPRTQGWSQVKTFSEALSFSPGTSLIVDAGGTLWMKGILEKDFTAHLGYLSPGASALVEVPQPLETKLFMGFPALTLDLDGRIRLESLIWNPDSQSWDDAMDSRLINREYTKLAQTLAGDFQVYSDRNGSLVQKREGAFYLAGLPIDRSSLTFIGTKNPDEFFWISENGNGEGLIHRFGRKKIVDLGHDYTGLPIPMGTPEFHVAGGKILFADTMGDIQQWINNRWESVLGTFLNSVPGKYTRLILKTNGDMLIGLFQSTLILSRSADGSVAGRTIEGPSVLNSLHGQTEDIFGNVWVSVSNVETPGDDYKVAVFRENGIESFDLPAEDNDSLVGLFSLQDKVYFITKNTLYGKNCQDNEPFAKVDAAALGLDFFRPDVYRIGAMNLDADHVLFKVLESVWTDKAKLYVWDARANTVTELPETPFALGRKLYRKDAFRSKDGQIVIWNDEGVYRLHEGAWEAIVSKGDIMKATMASADTLETVGLDDQDQLWILVSNKNLLRVKLSPK